MRRSRRLFICAQDNTFILVGLGDSNGVQKELAFETYPEGYLKAISDAFSQWQISSEVLDSIAVVTGPGSFTASRVSTTIANALAFAYHIPLFGFENPNRVALKDFFPSKVSPSNIWVKPFYDRPPEITQERKSWG